jgi:hypothetical protein
MGDVAPRASTVQTMFPTVDKRPVGVVFAMRAAAAHYFNDPTGSVIDRC